ncbi:MAG: Fic family protein [Sarcina sp.]
MKILFGYHQMELEKKFMVHKHIKIIIEVLERNANRDRKVSVNVIIDEMYKDLQVPMYFEGWDEIRIVRDESKKENKQEVDLKKNYLSLSIKDYENILSEIDEKNIDITTLVQLHMDIMRNENGEEGIEKLKNKFGIELFERIKLLHDADTQNWIGTRGAGIEGAIFIPPVPGDIIESLANLYEYMNDEFIDPLLVNTAIAHAQFETIHAYKDGNGRLSRALIPIQMAYLGQSKPILYLSEIIKLIFMPYKV